MTTDAMRDGGLAVWAPSITPPIGVELTGRQELACAFRILARSGFSENIAGHITWAPDDDGSMWVNPWGLAALVAVTLALLQGSLIGIRSLTVILSIVGGLLVCGGIYATREKLSKAALFVSLARDRMLELYPEPTE